MKNVVVAVATCQTLVAISIKIHSYGLQRSSLGFSGDVSLENGQLSWFVDELAIKELSVSASASESVSEPVPTKWIAKIGG